MKYEYWLANVQGISGRKKEQLYTYAGSAEALYYIEERQLMQWELAEKERKILLESAKAWKPEEAFQKLVEKGIACVPIHYAEYPSRLRNIPFPPYALYVKGKLPAEDIPTIAIVGARECSPYGREMTIRFANVLAKSGVQIVSGMARGIDGIAQNAALEAGGVSFAVLANGADICYPREHIGLYMDLQQEGGIVSEQALGVQPLPQFFPARNRIISGLADVVLVMEAKERSGSLITADMALEQGKDVYALPGAVTSRLSGGCHHLIRQGAGILTSPEELLEELGMLRNENLKISEENKNLLESEENLVYSCLDFTPKSIGYILEVTGLTTSKLLQILVSLELGGYIREIAKNFYVKVE